MRVLFVNSRPDAAQLPGGDTVQARKTLEALQCLGVMVETRAPDDLDRLPACDLAHVFNIQEAEPAWAVCQALQRKGLPVVLSPIFWTMYPYWFEAAVVERPRWRALARAWGKRRARRAYVSWQYLKGPLNRRWRAQRRLLQAAARLLPNSRSETRLLQRMFALGGRLEEKSDVVPNGIDPTHYAQLPQRSQAFVDQYRVRDFVLQVGTLNPVKNQLGLVEALRDLPVPIVIIGQAMAAAGDYGSRLRARAAARGNVTFVDHLPHEELPGIFALASVHALPSWRETPGLVSLEAAAAGCRVVTTAIGSTRDYFEDLAWYCWPDDQASIRRSVEAALQAQATNGLRERVLERYTWKRAGEATLAAYERALDRQP
ncbi:MAG: glycosyltransferase family 4 protein [Anaerolineales bacterium]|nr:glycosyltransferase family 4 protein [Anaerolineales bacterium]